MFRDITKDDDRPHTPTDLKNDRPDEVAQSRETQAAIEATIQKLPTRLREAFLLCELQGLSYEDAAAVLACPVKTVSTRPLRARQRFRAAPADHIAL